MVPLNYGKGRPARVWRGAKRAWQGATALVIDGLRRATFLHLQWRGLDSAKPHFRASFFGLIFNFVLSPTQLVSRGAGLWDCPALL